MRSGARPGFDADRFHGLSEEPRAEVERWLAAVAAWLGTTWL
jgi:hypothetical protein